jgi:hypothetical protein
MARKSHNKRHRGRGRRHRGGAAPLNAAAYTGSETGAPKWSASVSGGGPAAVTFKSHMNQIVGGNTGMGASQAMNSYAMKGGGSRRKRHAKGTRRRRRGGAGMNEISKMMESLMGGKAAAPAASTGGAAKVPTQAPAASTGVAKAMAPTASRAQGGGMFASFGALLKEALVPLGLLAAQQTYGKRHSKKHRSSGSHTRKHRR